MMLTLLLCSYAQWPDDANHSANCSLAANFSNASNCTDGDVVPAPPLLDLPTYNVSSYPLLQQNRLQRSGRTTLLSQLFALFLATGMCVLSLPVIEPGTGLALSLLQVWPSPHPVLRGRALLRLGSSRSSAAPMLSSKGFLFELSDLTAAKS